MTDDIVTHLPGEQLTLRRGEMYYSGSADYLISEHGFTQSDVDASALDLSKNAALELIEQKAGEYHAKIVGTADKSREARFALNLECAKKMIAGTATDAEQQMLQLQYDANKAAGHPVISKITLQQFAQWIVNFESITTLGAGLIEATLIKGRAAINAAQRVEEIEQIKVQLAAQAQAAFEQLQAQLSS